MHTIHLKNSSLLDRLLYLLPIRPGILKYLPTLAVERSTRMYLELLNDLLATQSRIHDLSIPEANGYKKDYDWLLKWLVRLIPKNTPSKPANKEFYDTINAVIDKLGENIFLMKLIINKELLSEDQLSDLLEDYRDGLLILQRKGEPNISWEQVKATLDVKHKLV